MITERTVRDSVPYDERERPAYELLCEAREALGRAHDKIADAVMNYGGGHQQHVSAATCDAINELIEKLHDACAAAS